MHLRDDELRGLPVETTAGEYVGRIVGFVMDTQGGIVVQYRVRPPGVAAALLASRELLIHQSQVVSLDAQRMVVESGGVPQSGGGRRRRMAPSISPQPLTSKQQ